MQAYSTQMHSTLVCAKAARARPIIKITCRRLLRKLEYGTHRFACRKRFIVQVKLEREEIKRINAQITQREVENPKEAQESFRYRTGTLTYARMDKQEQLASADKRRAELKRLRTGSVLANSANARQIQTEAAKINELLRIKREVCCHRQLRRRLNHSQSEPHFA